MTIIGEAIQIDGGLLTLLLIAGLLIVAVVCMVAIGVFLVGYRAGKGNRGSRIVAVVISALMLFANLRNLVGGAPFTVMSLAPPMWLGFAFLVGWSNRRDPQGGAPVVATSASPVPTANDPETRRPAAPDTGIGSTVDDSVTDTVEGQA